MKIKKVPKQYGRFDLDGSLDWHDNVENFTEQQCLTISDVVSKQTKVIRLQDAYPDDKFEQGYLHKKTIPIHD